MGEDLAVAAMKADAAAYLPSTNATTLGTQNTPAAPWAIATIRSTIEPCDQAQAAVHSGQPPALSRGHDIGNANRFVTVPNVSNGKHGAARPRRRRELPESASTETVFPPDHPDKGLAGGGEDVQRLFKASPIPAYSWKRRDRDWVLADWNDAGERLTGGHIREYLGRRLTEMYSDMPELSEEFERCDTSGAIAHRRISYKFRSSGESRWLDVTYTPIAAGWLLVQTEDVDARVRADEQLREQEARQRALLHAIPDMVFRYTTDGVCLDFHAPPSTADLAVPPDQIIGRRLDDILPPDIAKLALAASKRAFETGEVQQIEYAIELDAGLTHFEARIAKGHGELIAVVRNITDRRAVEQALHERQRLSQILLENAHDGICLLDRDGIILYANPAACQLFGGDPGELVGRFAADLVAPSDRERVITRITDLAGEAPKATPAQIRYRARGRDGRGLVVEVTSRPLTYEGNRALCSIIRDVTEEQQRENAAQHYRDTLRTLSVRLAETEERERLRIASELHDQAGQKLAAARLKLRALAGSPMHQIDVKAVREVEALVAQALTETRELMFELGPPDLQEATFVTAFRWMVDQATARADIDCRVTIGENIPDPGEPGRAIVLASVRELLRNVIKHAQAKTVEVELFAEGGALRVRFRDDGVGFDYREVDELPAVYKGFGLFAVRERLRSVGGSLEIRSRLGSGTAAALTVPLPDRG